MQVIIDEIVNLAVASLPEQRPSAEMMRQIINGAVAAVCEKLEKDKRMCVEQGLQPPRAFSNGEY
jgi:hypothetical protein